jgi:hypothetical protein
MAEMVEEQLDFLNELLDLPPADADADKDLEQDDKGLVDPEPVKEDLSVVDDQAGVVNETIQQSDNKDDSQQTIEELRKQILAMSESLAVDPLVQQVKSEVKVDASPEEQVQAEKILANFLSEKELDELIDNPGLINVAFQRSQQAMLATVGTLVQQEVNKQIVMQRAVTDFYTTNSDLLPYAKFVQFVMAETEQKNRDKTYAEIFATTATECRKRLGLSTVKTVTRETNKGVQKPAFAGSKQGNSRPSSTKEMFDSNAADMFNLR